MYVFPTYIQYIKHTHNIYTHLNTHYTQIRGIKQHLSLSVFSQCVVLFSLIFENVKNVIFPLCPEEKKYMGVFPGICTQE